MKCKHGEWKCPYVEETSGCCIKEKCPEWQDYENISQDIFEENISQDIFECEKKSWETWFEMERKIGEACAATVKDMDNLPVGEIKYLDY